MSLRYRLDKDRFKGKKLPPKVKTNDDHISEDQRGDHSSMDDPYSEGGIKHLLKQKLAHDADQMSRRGLFSGLNKLKDYNEEAEQKELEAAKKKKRKVKKKKPQAREEVGESVGEEELKADSPAVESESLNPEGEVTEAEPSGPKKGFFKRLSHRFFPSLDEEEEAAPRPRVKARPQPNLEEDGTSESETSNEPIYAMAPTDVVEEAKQQRYPDAEPSIDEEKHLDRRHMIKQSVHFFAKPVMDNVQEKIDKVNHAVDRVTKRPPLLRPPGAISEREFLKACTRCDKCIQACPKDAIKKVPKKMGWMIMDTPYIDPMKKPCVMCEDLPCITACQDEALLPVASVADVNMGYVILDKKHCVAYGDGFCQQCLIDCPVPGAITQVQDRPVFHRDICTGCGACVRACATVNMPVALKVKPQMVVEAQLRKKERELEEAQIAEHMEAERKRLEEEKAALEAEAAELARQKGWTDEEGPAS